MSGPLASSKTKAADLLLRAQVLSRPIYERVVEFVKRHDVRAEEVLLDQELMSEADLLKALSAVYQTHFVSTEKLSRAEIPRSTIQMIPKRVAETLGVFPVLFDQRTNALSIVTADPDNPEVLREVKLVSGAKDVKAFVARPSAVAAAIRKHHSGDKHAFDAFERAKVIDYEFGQQMGSDGVIAKHSSVRETAGSQPDQEEVAPARPAPPKKPPPPQSSQHRAQQAISLDDDDVVPVKPGRAIPLPDDDEPAPAAVGRRGGRKDSKGSISAPPPPMLETGPKPARSGGSQASADKMPKPPSLVMPAVAPEAPRTASTTNEKPGTLPPQSEAVRQNALANDTTIELLAVMVSLLENTRQELRGHSSQVARLLRRIAERMSLDRYETYSVIVAGHIHDLGKMGQFHLTTLNCSEYEGHKVAATKSFDTPLRLLEAVKLPPPIKNAVFHMYERFDGKGFPDKLSGKEIPLGARLLAIADTYADLTQNPRNPFRKVLGPAEAINVLAEHKGTIFDPSILDLLKSLMLGEDMASKLLASRYKALVVEPDPEESTVLELRMVEQGFDVKTARTVDAARKLLSVEGADFDLVVCELELPDIDGLAFLSEARKEKWGRDLPWVVHTAKQGRTEAQRAFDLGALDYVTKPIQADLLVAKLKAMLDQWSTGKNNKGVSGSLREMGLPDIVQILFHGRKTGKLNVRSGGKSGEIHFLEGNIANALIGSTTGTEAFYQMLKFEDGDFALDPGFAPPKRLIEESSEALLLEGMRRMDEGM